MLDEMRIYKPLNYCFVVFINITSRIGSKPLEEKRLRGNKKIFNVLSSIRSFSKNRFLCLNIEGVTPRG